jgi:glutamyl-tRNA synthetase
MVLTLHSRVHVGLGAGRFAPTPTGRLHLGNARTALLAWLWARASGLRRVLRIEDLDPLAIPPGVLEGQYADLAWLGLRYDEGPLEGGPCGPYRQSERGPLYADAIAALNERGLLYPCWCSRKEVQAATLAPHLSDESAVYPGTCRPDRCTPIADLGALPVRAGRRPSLRIHLSAALAALDDRELGLQDLLRGPVRAAPEHLGDFVVRRSDGVAAYQLACSVDDALMGCSQVLRGADLVLSGARQVLLLRTLALPVPRYAHVGLLLSATGERLSKRDGATALEELRAAGVSAAEVRRRLARLSGLPDTGDLDLLTESFAVERVGADDVRLPLG